MADDELGRSRDLGQEIGRPDISPSGNERRPNYLFVVSNGRQAYNAIAFLQDRKLALEAQTTFAVLYSMSNLKERNNITSQLTVAGLPYILIKMPTRAPYFSFQKTKRIERLYRHLLDTTNPSRVYVFNYNTHYGLLLHDVEQRNIPAFFIEEGISSYKVSHRYAAPRSFIEIFDKDIVGNSVLGHYLLRRPFEIARRFIRKLPGFVKQEIRFFHRLITVPFDNETMLNHFSWLVSRHPRHFRFHKYRPMFEEVYGTDIARLQQIIPGRSFETFNYLASALPALRPAYEELLSQFEITENSVLFVDQSYNVAKHAILQLALDWVRREKPDVDYFYIKPHPKSRVSEQQLAEFTYANRDIDIRIFAPAIPAEYIPVLTGCKTMLGVASTSLIYSRLLSPGMRACALYETLLAQVPMDRQTAGMIKEHGDIVRDAGVEIDGLDRLQVTEPPLAELGPDQVRVV